MNYRFALAKVELNKLMFYLTIMLTKIYVTVALGWHDSNESALVKLLREALKCLCLGRRLRFLYLSHTVKPVFNGHSKNNNKKKTTTEDLIANGSLMKVESNAECSLGACRNTFDLH